ncbi:MAG TPA: KH domain-containing protein [Candidatus Paceibacterota bacterium]|nr:KH domain-containing protein [Candidatus Paceibacterota bacterium]
MSDNTPDKEFLEFVVKNLVDHPDDVNIERKVDEMGVLLTLRVHPLDMGQVVGRQGMTAKSIRSLLRIIGVKHQTRVNLKIEEPEGSMHGQTAPAEPEKDESV